jgi:hypothetical protein
MHFRDTSAQRLNTHASNMNEKELKIYETDNSNYSTS